MSATPTSSYTPSLSQESATPTSSYTPHPLPVTGVSNTYIVLNSPPPPGHRCKQHLHRLKLPHPFSVSQVSATPTSSYTPPSILPVTGVCGQQHLHRLTPHLLPVTGVLCGQQHLHRLTPHLLPVTGVSNTYIVLHSPTPSMYMSQVTFVVSNTYIVLHPTFSLSQVSFVVSNT